MQETFVTIESKLDKNYAKIEKDYDKLLNYKVRDTVIDQLKKKIDAK